jgi:hypothetical protein
MFRSILSRLPLSVLFGAAVLVLAASHAEAGKPKKSKVEGQITAVSGGTVTFKTKSGTVALKVTTSTVIDVNSIDRATYKQLQDALTAATQAGNILAGDGYYDASTMNASMICADEQSSSSSGGDS